MSNYTNQKVSTFRERFVSLCDANPLGTVSLADELHVSRQTINAWKIGSRSPKDLTIIAIAKYFGVSVEWLMGFDSPKETTWVDYADVEEEQQPKSREAKIISEGIDKMTPERREQALKILQIAFSEFSDLIKEDNPDDA